MAVNPMYAKGYKVGYEKGRKDGLLGSEAKLVMERDMIFIYGTMAMVLIEKYGWSQESVEELIEKIQGQWMSLEKETPEGTYETMAELVERRTGIQLRQMVEDVTEGGWDE